MRAIPDFWFEPTLWINGAWQTARQHIEIKNPANSVPLAKVGFAQSEDIEKAIAGAEQALAGWRATRHSSEATCSSGLPAYCKNAKMLTHDC